MAAAKWAWSAGTSSSMWFVSHQQRNDELFALPSVQIGSQSVDACPPLSVGFECLGKLFCNYGGRFFLAGRPSVAAGHRLVSVLHGLVPGAQLVPLRG